MPKPEYPFWAAVRTVRSGLSGRAGLQAFRAGGGVIRDATWFRMIGEARAQIARRGDEVSAPINRRPIASEMTEWTTRTARGFLQQVEVIVRDKDTGEISAIPWSRSARNLVTRQTAVERALADIEFGTEGDTGKRESVLGAVYVGTMIMRP